MSSYPHLLDVCHHSRYGTQRVTELIHTHKGSIGVQHLRMYRGAGEKARRGALSLTHSLMGGSVRDKGRAGYRWVGDRVKYRCAAPEDVERGGGESKGRVGWGQ